MIPPLRVLHSVNSLAAAHGGPSRAIVALAEAQARAGARVQIASRPEAGHEAGPIIAPAPALVQSLPLPGSPLASGQALARIVAAHAAAPGPAILHDNGLWLPINYFAATAARRHGLPYVISPHGALSPWALAWHAARKRLVLALYQRRLLTAAAGLIASAEPERAHIRKLAPKTPIAVIPNGVDVPAKLPPKAPETPRTLLFLSRLHPVKNLPALISAWGKVLAAPTLADWQLRIIGPDEAGYAETLAPLIAALGPRPRITLEGPADDAAKAAAFSQAQAFILPSLSENFGIAVAEALAHGLPAITTTGMPWSDLVPAGAGWRCPPDAAALAATLVEALSLPPAALAAMGMRGRALVIARYGWPRIAAQSLAFYEWLLHGGPRPDFVET